MKEIRNINIPAKIICEKLNSRSGWKYQISVKFFDKMIFLFCTDTLERIRIRVKNAMIEKMGRAEK